MAVGAFFSRLVATFLRLLFYWPASDIVATVGSNEESSFRQLQLLHLTVCMPVNNGFVSVVNLACSCVLIATAPGQDGAKRNSLQLSHRS